MSRRSSWGRDQPEQCGWEAGEGRFKNTIGRKRCNSSVTNDFRSEMFVVILQHNGHGAQHHLMQRNNPLTSVVPERVPEPAQLAV